THLAAPQAQQTIAVANVAQMVTVNQAAPAGAAVGGPTYTPTATGGASGNPVTFTLDATSTGCTLTSGVIAFPAVGTCVVDADQAGNTSYLAGHATQTFTIAKGSQTIAFISTA